VMCVLALGLAWLSRMPRLDRFDAISRKGENATSQITLRLTVVLLFALLVVASEVGLDVVLGAFLAGMVLRRWAPADAGALEDKLDAVGYGFFIPVFFVSSGMALNVDSIVDAPLRLVGFFVLLVAVRGLPSLLLYRRDLNGRERVQMTLLTATSLPLLVALAAVGLDSGEMLPENAAALVGAGVLSVMVLPGLAIALNRTAAVPEDVEEVPAAEADLADLAPTTPADPPGCVLGSVADDDGAGTAGESAGSETSRERATQAGERARERSAQSHELTAEAHETAAQLLDEQTHPDGDHGRVAQHREAAERHRDAARDDREAGED
jgi:hypothetical protein